MLRLEAHVIGPAFIPCLIATSLSVSLVAMLSTNVIVVAPSGGDYSQIQPAIDAAANGDTILVKSGSYHGFAIVHRAGLDIVADAGAYVQILGNVRIRNCDGSIVLSGLTVIAPHSSNYLEQPGLALTDDSGSVRVMSCVLQSADSTGAWVRHSTDVEFAGSTFLGGGGNALPSAAPGVTIDQSSVVLYDDTLRGADGHGSECGYVGSSGGSGLVLQNQTFLFASRCDIQGGSGADVELGTEGGNGGAGIFVYDTSAVHVRDSNVNGGLGGNVIQTMGLCGCGFCCSCWTDGFPGPPYWVSSGATLDLIPGAGRTLSIPDIVREHQILQVQVGGVPGDLVSLLVTRAPGFAWQPLFSGVFLEDLSIPPRATNLGTIGSSGMLTVQIPIPDLRTGVLASNYYLQTAHRDSQGHIVLGSGRTLVVLDMSL